MTQNLVHWHSRTAFINAVPEARVTQGRFLTRMPCVFFMTQWYCAQLKPTDKDDGVVKISADTLDKCSEG